MSLDYAQEKETESRLEKIKAPEIIFAPNVVMKETAGITEMIRKTITQCEVDTRRALWVGQGFLSPAYKVKENIVVCGGSSMFKGFTERLQDELKKVQPENTEARIIPQKNRMLTVHQGASKLVFWDEFYEWPIAASDWEIEGVDIFNEKCLN